MEASHVTVRGEKVDRLDETLIEEKATESERSLNKWAARNVHKYEGDGITQLTYERGAAHEPSWLMVSFLVEQLDDRTATVAVFVGGGGRGPFKLEEVTTRRVLRGEDSVGESGRFGTVLADLEDACTALDLTVTTRWDSGEDLTLTQELEQKVFDS